MAYLVILLSLGTAACAALLLYRLRRLEADFRRRLTGCHAADGLNQQLARLLGRAAEAHLLTGRGPRGLAAIEVRFREAQDTARNLEELIDSLLVSVGATKFADLTRLIKSLYQLQHTLALPPSLLADCLRLLEARLRADTYLGKPIGRVEAVAPGTILDGKTMMALTPGTHVKQPLGFVVFDPDGRVLSKAKVLCS